MSRSWELFLRDLQEAAHKIRRYTADLDLETFRADVLVFDATLRNLEIMGEAAKGIPQEIRARNAEVDWKGIAGLRDSLAHACFGWDDATLWDIVHDKIPKVIPHLDRMVDELAEIDPADGGSGEPPRRGPRPAGVRGSSLGIGPRRPLDNMTA